MSERDVIVAWMRMALLDGPAETVYADAIEEGKHLEGLFSSDGRLPPESLSATYTQALAGFSAQDAVQKIHSSCETALRRSEVALRRSEAEVRRMTIVARAGWESARDLAVAGLHRATERAADEALAALDAGAL